MQSRERERERSDSWIRLSERERASNSRSGNIYTPRRQRSSGNKAAILMLQIHKKTRERRRAAGWQAQGLRFRSQLSGPALSPMASPGPETLCTRARLIIIRAGPPSYIIPSLSLSLSLYCFSIYTCGTRETLLTRQGYITADERIHIYIRLT